MKNQPLLTHFYLNNDVAITFDHRTMGTNPFRVLLVPLRPTCGQSMGPKLMEYFGTSLFSWTTRKNEVGWNEAEGTDGYRFVE